METQARQSIAQSTQQALKGAQVNYATQNAPGIGSGAQAQLLAGLNQQGAIQTSNAETGITEANAQEKLQQQQFALGQLGGPVAQLTTGALGTGNQLNASLGQQFGQQTQMNSKGTLLQNILGGLAGAGLSFATGGLSNLTQGLSFLGNATGGGGGGSTPGGTGAGAGSGAGVYS
jgi:hypothetical protein